MNLPEINETLEIPESELREADQAQPSPQEPAGKNASELQQRNVELEAYAHTVAHNLKNPLTVLVATADLITDVPDLTRKELREYLEQIRSIAFEMNSIVDNLLLLSEASQVEVTTGPVDMASVVATMRRRLGHLIKTRHAQIGYPKSWPTAMGYGPWVEEVWANYLSNAIKYGGEPPCVELGAAPQPGGMIRFWVRDHGPGIPPEAQKRLFTPFTQLGQAHQGGHGLGLAIVLHIVEKLGGQVGVESEGSKGSLFFFTLPAAPASDRSERLHA